MVEIHKKIVLDEDQKPFAVQTPINEFELLEDLMENYGLSRLMDEVKNEERLLTVSRVEDRSPPKKSGRMRVKGRGEDDLRP